MVDNTETELKLQFLAPGRWEELFAAPVIQSLADPLSFRQETLETQYYDTPGHRLQKAGLAFRIRREGAQWIATVKDGGRNVGGLHERAEWNVLLSAPQADAGIFADTPVGPVLADTIGEETLTAMFRTCFERQRINLQLADGSVVELAADRGEIHAGGKEAPLLEIELELKAGKAGALLELGAELAKSFPLLPEWRSKYFRALQLAGLAAAEEAAVPAVPPLSGGETAGEALTGILISSIQGLLAAQEKFLQQQDVPEMLRAWGSELWQLRSLLSFSEALMPAEVYGEYQQILTEWTDMLTPLAELDPVLAVWQDIAESTALHWTVPPVLGGILGEKRGQLAAGLAEKLQKGATTPALLSLWAWLTTTGLSGQLAVEPPDSMARPPFDDFVRKQLARWRESILAAGKKIDLQDTELICLLRLQALKICAIMAMLPLKWPKKIKRQHASLRKLLAGFDYLHDLKTTAEIVRNILKSQSSRLLYRDTGILTGWQAREARTVCRKLNKRWKKLLATESK